MLFIDLFIYLCLNLTCKRNYILCKESTKRELCGILRILNKYQKNLLKYVVLILIVLISYASIQFKILNNSLNYTDTVSTIITASF